MPATFEYPWGTGRGALAKYDVAPGDIVVSVPQHLLLSLDAVAASELAILGMTDRLSDATQLAAFLLHERNLQERSVWHPYLQILPTSYDTTLYYSPADRAALSANCALRTDAILALLSKELALLKVLVGTLILLLSFPSRW